MPNPRYINSTPPAPPTKFTATASLAMTRKQKKEIYRLLYPLTRPAHISPKKRVKWRLQQKWFKRYEKRSWIGRMLMAEAKDGQRISMHVTDIRRSKDGGHGYNLDIDAKPIIDHGTGEMP